jgi:hypothetical protein
MVMLAIFVHVGQTPNIPPSGKNPIFNDGTFKFVPIYVESPRQTDPTYEQLGFGTLVNNLYKNLVAFKSPEFETLTYNHVTRGAQGNVYERLKNEGGFIFFYSTLHYQDRVPPINPEISSSSGAYIIGYFKAEGIYTTEEVVASSKLQDRFKSNGQLGRFDDTGKQRPLDLWISGLKDSCYPKPFH